MAIMYCALCNRPVEAKRQIGAVTVLLAVATAGMSLLAVPFYAKRCSICKSTAVSPTVPQTTIPASGMVVRITELERRLNATELELESANTELDRLRTERDFYHQLLADPARDRNRMERG